MLSCAEPRPITHLGPCNLFFVALLGLLQPPRLKLAQLCHLQLLLPATPVGLTAATAAVRTWACKAAAAAAEGIHIPGLLAVCILATLEGVSCIAAAGIVCEWRVIIIMADCCV